MESENRRAGQRFGPWKLVFAVMASGCGAASIAAAQGHQMRDLTIQGVACERGRERAPLVMVAYGGSGADIATAISVSCSPLVRASIPAGWGPRIDVLQPTSGFAFLNILGFEPPLTIGQAGPDGAVRLEAREALSRGLPERGLMCLPFHGAEVCVWAPPRPQGLVVVLAPAAYGMSQRMWRRRVPTDELARENVVAMLAPAASADPTVFADHPGGARWGEWIEAELVPLLEERFHAPTDRRRRVLVGFSTGGLGAVLLGLDRPETFATIIAASPDPLSLAEGLVGPDGGVRPFWVERARVEELVRERAELTSYREVYGGELPFTLGEAPGEGGDLIEPFWKQWLARSALGRVSGSRARNALAGGRVTFVLTCGTADPYGLLAPTRALVDRGRAGGLDICWRETGLAHEPPGWLWDEAARRAAGARRAFSSGSCLVSAAPD